ncbi:MAG TPA: AgmX/PglI C-terminal domain-containing protein [Labilithrix sp.]|nr:AgmX/PglI C-terminal domain-containing protein [Labilithrix sp.]
MKAPTETPNRRAKPVEGKKLLLGLLLALFVVVGLVFYFGVSGGSTHVPLSKPGIGFTTDPAASGSAAGPAAGVGVLDAALTKTVADRAVRDELRRRILAGWAAGADPEIAAAAKQGRFLPAPTGDGGQGMEPAYIQEVVRSEFFPMARACFDELLSRKQDAGGRVEMSFTIVADEKLGGLVEDVAVGTDGGVADEKMTTCMRESMTTLAFRPPAHGGIVTVVYPIEFSAHDRDE